MKALDRLYLSGMTRASVAAATNSDSQLIGMYERGERFPGKKKFCLIVEAAEARGVLLLARDFIADESDCVIADE